MKITMIYLNCPTRMEDLKHGSSYILNKCEIQWPWKVLQVFFQVSPLNKVPHYPVVRPVVFVITRAVRGVILHYIRHCSEPENLLQFSLPSIFQSSFWDNLTR